MQYERVVVEDLEPGVETSTFFIWIGPDDTREICAAQNRNCGRPFADTTVSPFEVGVILGATAAGFVPVLGEFVDLGFCLYDGSQWLFADGSRLSAGISCGALAVPFVPAAASRYKRLGVAVAGNAVDNVRVASRIADFRKALRRPNALEIADVKRFFCGSFSGDTPVLMADGSLKPIVEVQVGDAVWATNPATGESATHNVTATWPHQDTLVDLVVQDGSITTTEDHEFWNITDQAWQEARDFDPGDELLTSYGYSREVVGFDWSTSHFNAAYDLTVDELHSYYVSVGDVDVLAHNCGVPLPRGTKPAGFRSPNLDNKPGIWFNMGSGNFRWKPDNPVDFTLPGGSLGLGEQSILFTRPSTARPQGGSWSLTTDFSEHLRRQRILVNGQQLPNTFVVPGMTGTGDRAKAIALLKRQLGLRSTDTSVDNALRGFNLHHFGCTMQIVPVALHAVSHNGSSADLRNNGGRCP